MPRSSVNIPVWRKACIIVISTAEPSTIAASTTWPFPERCRSTSAHTTPNASSMPPPPKSPTRLRGGSGFSPRRPRWKSVPDSAM